MTHFIKNSCGVILVLALLAFQPGMAAEIRYDISGVAEPLLTNVRNHLNQFGIAGGARISARRFEALRDDVEQRVREALKPYGYYAPEITSNLVPAGEENWRMRIRIRPGQPVRVAEAHVEVQGAGSDRREFRAWRRGWPLPPGSVLDQPRWKQQKREALAIAADNGFLTAGFSQENIAIDLAENTARLTLVLDTGTQAQFGSITFEQDILQPWVLGNIPRFEPGSPYSAELLEKFRLDLWRTGYFTDIEVREERLLDRSPAVVNLHARLSSAHRDTWQGMIGFGTDTGIRLQGLWSRHRLSSRGDRLDVGTGYREIDDEFSVKADYRIPRRSAKRQYWIASSTLRSENQDLEFKRRQDDAAFVKLATGQVDEVRARIGRLHVRDREQGFEQVLETIYMELVRESFAYSTGDDAPPDIQAFAADPRFSKLFADKRISIAIGIEWDWPAISGSGFATEGHRERAWLFTSNRAWGSGRDYTQAYIASRRSYLFGERWKLLLRAEAGYSDAAVEDLGSSINGDAFTLSVTSLPDSYRFKAGGSSSVRGYGFEELSNNDIGSNNILTASAEVEFKLTPKWSVAAFADIGNAFNDWDETNLRKGVGVGIRWYTVAGAIRLDFAQGLDIEGKPLRVHFTVGSPLLW